jgi:hypothetical protein
MYSLLILDIIEQRKFIDKNKFHCLIKFDVVCLADELIDKINKKKIQKTSLKNAPQKQNGTPQVKQMLLLSHSLTLYLLIYVPSFMWITYLQLEGMYHIWIVLEYEILYY